MTGRMVAFSSACGASSETFMSYPPCLAEWARVTQLASKPVTFRRVARSDPLAACVLEGALNPGAVDGAGFDGGHRLSLAFLFCVGGAVDLLRLIEGHADDPVVVADDEVARLDDHAVERDRGVHLAGPVLVGAAMGDAGCEDRQRTRPDPP